MTPETIGCIMYRNGQLVVLVDDGSGVGSAAEAHAGIGPAAHTALTVLLALASLLKGVLQQLLSPPFLLLWRTKRRRGLCQALRILPY